MTESESRVALTSVSPFFIVRDLERALSFYRSSLGFDVVFRAPDVDPFFGIVRRGGVQLLLKVVAEDVPALPNSSRHPLARWDAFVNVPDPDGLAAEFASRGVAFHTELADTEDNLRGFEIQDADGYVLFFGRPR